MGMLHQKSQVIDLPIALPEERETGTQRQECEAQAHSANSAEIQDGHLPPLPEELQYFQKPDIVAMYSPGARAEYRQLASLLLLLLLLLPVLSLCLFIAIGHVGVKRDFMVLLLLLLLLPAAALATPFHQHLPAAEAAPCSVRSHTLQP